MKGKQSNGVGVETGRVMNVVLIELVTNRLSRIYTGADTGGCIGAYAPPGHSRECWCTPCGSGIKSQPIEIRNRFQYNLIEIDISDIFYKYFRAHKDPGSHFCAEDNFSASAL